MRRTERGFFGKVSLLVSSLLADVAHNEWASGLFDLVCGLVEGDVELFDEDDTVIQTRRQVSA